MTQEESFQVALDQSKAVIVDTLKEMSAIYDWLIISEDDLAINSISVMALGLILRNMPTGIAVAMAVKGYHEVLEDR